LVLGTAHFRGQQTKNSLGQCGQTLRFSLAGERTIEIELVVCCRERRVAGERGSKPPNLERSTNTCAADKPFVAPGRSRTAIDRWAEQNLSMQDPKSVTSNALYGPDDLLGMIGG